MPLLYGEGGSQAFFRLQREIIQQSGDDSILAWTRPQEERRLHQTLPYQLFGTHLGILAPDVSYFADSHDIVREEMEWRKPYEITRQHVKIHGRMRIYTYHNAPRNLVLSRRIASWSEAPIVILTLNCGRLMSMDTSLHGVSHCRLVLLPSSMYMIDTARGSGIDNAMFVRCDIDDLGLSLDDDAGSSNEAGHYTGDILVRAE